MFASVPSLSDDFLFCSVDYFLYVTFFPTFSFKHTLHLLLLNVHDGHSLTMLQVTFRIKLLVLISQYSVLFHSIQQTVLFPLPNCHSYIGSRILERFLSNSKVVFLNVIKQLPGLIEKQFSYHTSYKNIINPNERRVFLTLNSFSHQTLNRLRYYIGRSLPLSINPIK